MIDKIALTLCLGAAALIIMNMYFPDTWLRITGRPAVNVQAPALPTVAPRPAPAPALPTAQPAPAPAPVVLPVQNDAPAPVVQPQPAEAPQPVVIIHRIEASGAQTITGSGACAAARSVARRCGK